ncbi:MAG: DUF2281 domain-containing protein [Candidatus Caenarcaniphilales bacterium]|nr:DUF2281 domain-containing protein [Candidatus Caenarcaniphilales bacterium]
MNESIKDIFQDLSPEEVNEVIDFAGYLKTKRQKATNKKQLTFEWRGGLEDLKENYTSVELQKKAIDWLGEDKYVSD